MKTLKFSITTNTLDLHALIQAVVDKFTEQTPSGIGAVTSFLGIVRGENMGRRVLRLNYEAYEPLAIQTFNRLDKEVNELWPKVSFGIHHRLGQLEVGEASIAIAVASLHRPESFAVCRYTIERVKQILPVWKQEFFDGGDTWIEGSTADPNDEKLRQSAYQQACG